MRTASPLYGERIARAEACTGLRKKFRSSSQSLPQGAAGTSDEVLGLIFGEALAGSGIGYVDAHLLAAARPTPAPL